MSVGTIGGGLTYNPYAGGGSSSSGSGPTGSADPVAALLGLSTADLSRQLQVGFSLNDIAASKAIGHGDLTSAIKATLPPSQRYGSDAAGIAEQISGTAGVSWPPAGAWSSGSTQSGQWTTSDARSDAAWSQDLSFRISLGPVLAEQPAGDAGAETASSGTPSGDPVADLFGMNHDDLTAQLAEGSTLENIAGSKGIGRDDLLTAIKDGLPADQRAADDADSTAAIIAGTVNLQWSPVVPDQPSSDGEPAPLAIPATDPVADLLGMNHDDLTAQLDQGSSLNEIADSRAIDRGDLLSAIQNGLPEDARRSADATAIAEQVAGTHNLQWSPVLATGDTGDAGQASGSGDPVADLLRLSRDDLSAQLDEGSTLSDIAASRGIDRGALLGSIVAGLPADQAGSADPAGIAVQIADTVHPQWPPGVTPQATDTQSDPVADLLGMSVETLNLQLGEGVAVDQIAASKGISHDQLITAIISGLPADQRASGDATSIAEQISQSSGQQWPPDGFGLTLT